MFPCKCRKLLKTTFPVLARPNCHHSGNAGNAGKVFAKVSPGPGPGLRAVSDLVSRKEVLFIPVTMRLANVSTYQNDFSGFRGRWEWKYNLASTVKFQHLIRNYEFLLK